MTNATNILRIILMKLFLTCRVIRNYTPKIRSFYGKRQGVLPCLKLHVFGHKRHTQEKTCKKARYTKARMNFVAGKALLCSVFAKFWGYMQLVLILGCGADSSQTIACPVLLSPSSCSSSFESRIVRIDLNSDEVCTGVILDEKRVLTAAHCVVGKSEIKVNGEQVSNISVHPNYRRDDQLAAFFFDVAIIRVENESPLLEIGSAERGDVVTVYGLGMDKDESIGNLQQGLLRITDVSPNHLLSTGKDNQAQVCFGDSGGPVFKDQKLVGLISSGSQIKCGGNDRVLITRLDVVNSWILGNSS